MFYEVSTLKYTCLFYYINKYKILYKNILTNSKTYVII